MLYSVVECFGILNRMQRMHRIHWKRNVPGINRPCWVPHAGGQDDGSLNIPAALLGANHATGAMVIMGCAWLTAPPDDVRRAGFCMFSLMVYFKLQVTLRSSWHGLKSLTIFFVVVRGGASAVQHLAWQHNSQL